MFIQSSCDFIDRSSLTRERGLGRQKPGEKYAPSSTAQIHLIRALPFDNITIKQKIAKLDFFGLCGFFFSRPELS